MSELTPRQKLENALALNRGIEFLANVKFSTTTHTGSMKGMELGQRYFDIHKALYQDSHSIGGPDSADLVKRGASGQIKEEINRLAEELFDSNGYFKPKEQLNGGLATVLANGYKSIMDVDPKPFSYGNGLTTRLFFTMLGRMPAFDQNYGTDIDFRRLDAEDVKTLQDRDASVNRLSIMFSHVLDASRTPKINSVETFRQWKDESTTIEGLRFLTHHKGGKEYLVTVNGGLVERDQIVGDLKKHLTTPESLVGDFRVPRNKIRDRDYLIDDLKGKDKIDGIDVKESVPLICMDTNSITGLSTKNHARLLNHLKSQGLEGDVLFQLADRETAQRVLESTRESGDKEMLHIMEVVNDRVHHLRNFIDQEKEKLFEGKRPVSGGGKKPHLFFSMGGSGTGKSSVEELAKQETNDNYVKASLDEARKVFDVYKVLGAVGHHADDYVAVEDMATTLREWTTRKALGEGYNVLYDGSGISFKPRYSDLAAKAKKQGYTVSVGAADCLLTVPEHRKEEFPDGAIDRAINRAEEEKRALPWNVTVGKHIGFPSSLMEALGDRNVDKIVLDDRAGKKGSAYLMAESFDVDSAKLQMLRSAKQKGNLLETLRDQNLLPANTGKREANVPTLTEDNIDFVHKVVAGKNRIFVTNNVTRMIDLAQKGLLNPHAQGEENLTYIRKDLGFHVPDIDTPNHQPHKEGHLRLNDPSEGYKRSYVVRYNREKTDPTPGGGKTH